MSGILVPPGDVGALVEAIARLADDARLREDLGKNARRRVEERFDISRNVGDYVALFAERGPEPGTDLFSPSNNRRNTGQS